MEKILEFLKSALEEAHQLIAIYKEKMTQLETAFQAFEESKKAHETKVKDVSAREAAIEPVENINKVQRENDAATLKLSQDRSDFEQMKATFQTNSSAVRQQLDEREKELNERQKHLDIRAKSIDEEVKKKVEDFISKFKK